MTHVDESTGTRRGLPWRAHHRRMSMVDGHARPFGPRGARETLAHMNAIASLQTIDTKPARKLAAIAGILLVLVTAQPASAAVTWAGDVKLASTDSFQPRILRTGAASAIAIWQRGPTAYARRTADGGKTWSARQTIASNIEFRISAASSGARVDIAYTKRYTTSTGAIARRLYYRRSADGGATWGSQRALTSTTSQVADQAIAHRSTRAGERRLDRALHGQHLHADEHRSRRDVRRRPGRSAARTIPRSGGGSPTWATSSSRSGPASRTLPTPRPTTRCRSAGR